jgi:hypothetical protein
LRSRQSPNGCSTVSSEQWVVLPQEILPILERFNYQ